MKKNKFLNKTILSLFGVICLGGALADTVCSAENYDSVSNGYYKLYGNFWWDGSAYQTEKGTDWYANPPEPLSVYKPDAEYVATKAELGYLVESIYWFDANAAPVSRTNPTATLTHQKRCHVNYIRAFTTPTTDSISVSNAYKSSNTLYWVRENYPTYVTYQATQDFSGTTSGFNDYIATNYITFAVNGDRLNNTYITNNRWQNSINTVNSNLQLSVSYREMRAGNVKGDTNRTMYSTVNAALKGNNTEVELGGKSYSANGNVSSLYWSGIRLKCDAINPTATISSSYISNGANVVFTASDTGSGLASIKYKLSGAQNQDWTSTTNGGSINITTWGSTVVSIKAIDNVGNEYETSKTIVTDNTIPTVTHNINPSGWTNGDVIISISASDLESGLKNITLPDSSVVNSSNATFNVSVNGSYTFKATDNAENVNTYTVNITNIDKTSPNISLSKNISTWTNGNIIVKAAITENESGVSVKKWAAGNQNANYFANLGYNVYFDNFTVTTNGTYTFYVKDKAGNESVKTINITNIDKTLSSITGILDYPWIRGDRNISINAIDGESGLSSLTLWNENKNNIIKNGIINGNTASLLHSITEEGITRYKIETIDVANNITTQDVTVRIDNTAPNGTITVPSATNDKTFTIQFSNLVDTLSGLKEAIISENSAFSSSNTVRISLTDIQSVNDTKDVSFKLSGKSKFEEQFSTRTIYVRIYDVVGNYKDYSYNIALIPKKPEIPKIVTPTEDQLYISKEIINLKWAYNSEDEDVGYLPQIKAEIVLKHIESGKIRTFTVDGEIFNRTLSDLENGEYDVKVRVYNYDNVFSESATRRFRVNKFKSDGNVLTVDISAGSPIRYISILTESSIPTGTSIKGKVYYSVDSKGNFDKSKYVEFNITNQNSISNIMKLPKDANKIKIEYFLKGSNADNTIAPILDNLIVLAK